jgi:carbon-monoxide dehydrogenase large subunit
MAHWGIGASVPRREDERFLTGGGQFVADIRVPGPRDVAFVRSPLPPESTSSSATSSASRNGL